MRRSLPLALSAPLLASAEAAAQSVRLPSDRPPTLYADWERRYDHGILGHDNLFAAAFGPNGEAYAAGTSLGLTSSYTYEIVTLCYEQDGTLRWERRYDSPGSGFDDKAVDLSVTPQGDLVVLAGC